MRFQNKVIKVGVLKRRLKAFYKVATPEQLESGKAWYNLMQEWVKGNSELELYKSVGIFAALSPQMGVDANKNLFKQYLTTGRAKHYGILNKKCDAIMQAGTICEVYKILNGKKIRAFYMNILFPNKVTETTLDRHALACLFQLPDQVTTVDNYNMTVKQYNVFSSIYMEVANDLSLLPQQLQAITWESYRSLRGLQEFKHVPF